METFFIYKNIAMAICAFALIHQSIRYLLAEKAVKAHYNQRRWRRWDEDHSLLELSLKTNAFELIAMILLTMIVVIM